MVESLDKISWMDAPIALRREPGDLSRRSTRRRHGVVASDWITDDAKSEIPPTFKETWNTVRLLGRGAFAEVHKVLTDNGIQCAAKTIRLPVQLGDAKDAPEVRSEISKVLSGEMNLCRLRHQNIVRMLHISERPNFTVVIFMELLSGVSLEQRINNGSLEHSDIRGYTAQICSALAYMHGLQPSVIHRDINGSNMIVLADSNQIKLIDFGLSIKLFKEVSHYTASSVNPKGTMNFMAPELLATESEDSIVYSRESDIWALGCTVYQMAAGKRPHAECKNPWALPELVKTRGAPALPDGCSAELRDFYSCCVARDRRKRKSAADLLEHGFLADEDFVMVAPF